MENWIYYDPDFRHEKNDNKTRCIRCQKEIKDMFKAVQVETTFDLSYQEEEKIGWAHCRESKTGKHYIGADCWKVITKNK